MEFSVWFHSYTDKAKFKMKCERCGKCCLSSPCFYIPIGKEKYKDGKHDCPYFSIKNKIAACAVYDKIKSKDGRCTNTLLKNSAGIAELV
ncbi:MAG: hypothetical protein ACFFG0_24485 [Candidatus Thorarchaeota archaeon]